MDTRFWGAVIVLLVILSGGAALAMLTLGQWLMALAFVGSVVVYLGKRLSGDSDDEDDASGGPTRGPDV